MKKILLCALMAVMALGAAAQTEADSLRHELDEANAKIEKMEKDKLYKSVWGRNKYFHISYASLQTAPENSPVEKSKFGVALSFGRTIMFPKRPLWGMVKFGIDLMIPDITVAKLKSDKIYNDDWNIGGDDPLEEISDLGRWTATAGVGIGPIATVTPFANMNGNAAHLKVSVYFHYKPSAGVYFVSDNGDTEASWAFCNLFDFGARITWKVIGVGVEGHWGSGKFKPFDFGDDEEIADVFQGLAGDKYKRKFASTRVYLSLTF